MAAFAMTEQNFQETLDNHDIVLIDFWASWCGPCRMFGPIFERVSEGHPDLAFAKVDTEDQQGLAASFRVRSIPTLAIFRDGILVYMQPGVVPEAALEDLIGKVEALDMDEVRAAVAQEKKAAANASAPAA